MKKYTVVLLAALALGLSACGDSEPPRVIPTVTSTPHVTSTPTQEELSAQAEQAYRAFFAEWKRLEFEGGATEPTQPLLDNGAGKYLEGVMLFLRDQDATGYTVEGAMPTTTVIPNPGETDESSDPRLTLAVCEDSSASWHTDDAGRHQGQISQGTVYLRVIDSRMKVVWANTELVEKCAL